MRQTNQQIFSVTAIENRGTGKKRHEVSVVKFSHWDYSLVHKRTVKHALLTGFAQMVGSEQGAGFPLHTFERKNFDARGVSKSSATGVALMRYVAAHPDAPLPEIAVEI